MPSLTTHVLDTSRGIPAAGISIRVYRFDAEGRQQLLKESRTNADGRTDTPLLSAEELQTGIYQIWFEVDRYFAEENDTPFLNAVPVQFGISDPSRDYHIPLLISAFGYSTYRGS